MTRRRWLDRALERRAAINARAISHAVIGPAVLEVGAAEGWVGRTLRGDDPRLQIRLLDVVDLNETTLPLTVYDGRTFPFPDRSFDTVLVLLTLHHCADPERVLSEAARVARRRLVVSESVYRVRPGRWLLWGMDNALNGVRSGGRMPGGSNFAPVEAWRDRFRRLGLALVEEKWLSTGLHRHVVFILDPPPATEPRDRDERDAPAAAGGPR